LGPLYQVTPAIARTILIIFSYVIASTVPVKQLYYKVIPREGVKLVSGSVAVNHALKLSSSIYRQSVSTGEAGGRGRVNPSYKYIAISTYVYILS